MLKNEYLEYQAGTSQLQAYVAYDDTHTEPRPAILVAHDWTGRNAFACKKADQLAELGYVGFALDMFGGATLGNTKEEKSALIQPLMQDRSLLQKRIIAAFDTVKTLPLVDKTRIGAIGFCFGGLCVLDLARSGAAVKGVVSFHGLLHAPNLGSHNITASILALHGYDDPMVTPAVVNAFAEEMTHAKVDWQLHMYGNTLHAFTNPEANDEAFGTVYSKRADARSWLSMTAFFEEML